MEGFKGEVADAIDESIKGTKGVEELLGRGKIGEIDGIGRRGF